jgi:hypothetical protein
MVGTARSRSNRNIFMKTILTLSLTLLHFYVSGQVNPTGKTVESRFNLPPNYQRLSVDKNSFGEYLCSFPLKMHSKWQFWILIEAQKTYNNVPMP